MLNIYNSWVNSAGVRKQINVDQNVSNGEFYLQDRQPLINFAKRNIIEYPDLEIVIKNRDWLLQQSFYFYLQEIVSLETNFICASNSGIINDEYSVKFDNDSKIVASTIIIDEGFHTNSALLAIAKLKELTQIKPIKIQHESNLYTILQQCYKLLDPKIHQDFNLIVNCILENTVTKDLDLFLMKKEESRLNSFTLDLLEKHFRDEARHSLFAYQILTIFWAEVDEDEKIQLLPTIRYFVNEYLKHDILQDICFRG